MIIIKFAKIIVIIFFFLTRCPYQLSRKVVQNVHLSGGSLLGVSRGGPSVSEIVDSMEVALPVFSCFVI